MSAQEKPPTANPFELERHPMLITLTSEETKNPAYIDAFTKKHLARRFNQTPLVDVMGQEGSYQVVRGWQAVLLARQHILQTIAVRLVTLDDRDVIDNIYLELLLATQIAPGRELTAFRTHLNKRLIQLKSGLLDKLSDRQMMNGMPTSTGYRTKGKSDGSKRGRKKKSVTAAEVQRPVNNPSSPESLMPAPPEHQPNQEANYESEYRANSYPPI